MLLPRWPRAARPLRASAWLFRGCREQNVVDERVWARRAHARGRAPPQAQLGGRAPLARTRLAFSSVSAPFARARSDARAARSHDSVLRLPVVEHADVVAARARCRRARAGNRVVEDLMGSERAWSPREWAGPHEYARAWRNAIPRLRSRLDTYGVSADAAFADAAVIALAARTCRLSAATSTRSCRVRTTTSPRAAIKHAAARRRRHRCVLRHASAARSRARAMSRVCRRHRRLAACGATR